MFSCGEITECEHEATGTVEHRNRVNHSSIDSSRYNAHTDCSGVYPELKLGACSIGGVVR